MILDQFSLAGKTAIVTGASTGLGQGISIAFAEAGANVVGVDYVDMPQTKEIIEKAGGKFVPVVANLMTLDPLDGIIKTAVDSFGHLDILVNNAGIIRRQDAIEFTVENWDDVININLRTVFFFSQKAAQ